MCTNTIEIFGICIDSWCHLLESLYTDLFIYVNYYILLYHYDVKNYYFKL